jgi:hypothetical protein
LALYDQPDPHSKKVLERVPKDALVQLLEGFPFGCYRKKQSTDEAEGWCPVAYKSQTRWVNAFYLSTQGRTIVDLKLLDLPWIPHSALSSDNALLIIPKGKIVDVDRLSDCHSGWGLAVPACPVRYAGASGLVNAMLLSFDGSLLTSAPEEISTNGPRAASRVQELKQDFKHVSSSGESIGWMKTSDVGCSKIEEQTICNPLDHYTDAYQRGEMCATYGVPFYDRPNGSAIGLVWGEMQIVLGEKSKDGKWTHVWTQPGQHIRDGGVWPYSEKALRGCG